MSIDRWMDKEVMVHMYNGILLRHKKEHIWVSSNEVDEPRAYYTDWSNSRREKQILYINAYMWTLERWYWWISLQDSSGDTDIENRCVDTAGEGEPGMNWKSSVETYTLPYVKQTASGNLLYDARHSNLVLCDNLAGWDGEDGGRKVQEGGDIGISMADSCWCMAEAITIF